VADKGGIQLLPETKRKIEVKVPGENRLIYAGSAAIAVVILLFFGLNTYVASLENRLKTLDNQLLALNSKRDKKSEADLNALQKQTELISQLLNRHIFWTQALGKIENSFQPQAQLSGLIGSADKRQIILSGKATNYSTVAHEISSLLASDGVQDVNVDSIKTTNTGNLEFILEVMFDENKFLLKSAH